VSRWGTAVWGTDTWDALTVAELCQRPPAADRGALIGIGDWRLVVEALLPSDGPSIWGVGVWGEAQWNVLAWEDLTPWVRGLDWSRGSDEPYGRPRVGDLTITLDSADDRWSPWNPAPPTGGPAYFAPGTIVRVGVRSASDTRAGGWLPQITAIVDTWGQTYVGLGTDRFVDLTAVETLRDLATIDDNALPGVVGGGEDPVTRIERLLEAAEWKYGLKVEAQHLLFSPGSYPLQSTDMSSNRLAECYLTADSCDVQFRTDRTGAALLTNIEYVGVVGDADESLLPLSVFSWVSPYRTPYIGFDWITRASTTTDVQLVAYDPDSFDGPNSDDAVINDCRFARVGGTQQTFEQLASISRFGRRTFTRNDLIATTDPVVQQIAQYTTIRRGLNSLRVAGLTVQTTDLGDIAGLTILAADVQSGAFVYPPDHIAAGTPGRVYVQGFVAAMKHQVTARNGQSVTWQTTFGFDTRTVNNLPAAQLPATPA